MRKYIFCTAFLFMMLEGDIFAQIPAQILPDFEFSHLDKRPFTNRNLPHNEMLLFIFFDPDCDHCQHAVKNIDRQYQAFKKTAVYLISLDGPDKINAFMAEYGSRLKSQKNVTLLQDKLNQFITKFKPYRYPAMFLYSAEQKLVAYEDNDESVFRLVNAVNKMAK